MCGSGRASANDVNEQCVVRKKKKKKKKKEEEEEV
jgi:hypothetical protein